MPMMIAKFHRLIQSKVIWGIFLGVVIIAFVGIYTPGVRSRGVARRLQREAMRAGRLFGEEISRKEFESSHRSVYIMYSMLFGRPIELTKETEPFLRKLAWQRLATLKKADQMNIRASEEEVRAMIMQHPIFRDKDGKFSAVRYKNFANGFLARNYMSEADLERMFAEQVRINKIHNMVSQGALVTDSEIKKAFHFYTDRLVVNYASIPHEIVKEVNVTEADARNYYEANTNEFLLPEKVLVKYVEFPVSNYLASVKLSEDTLKSYYEQNKYRYILPQEGTNATVEMQYRPFEEVKDELAAEKRKELAQQKAADLADEFVAAMADEGATFEGVAARFGLKVVENIPAFSRTEKAKGVDPTAGFEEMAFTLQDDETHFYSDPAVGQDKVYVLRLIKKLPSFVPPFEAVKEEALAKAKIEAEKKSYAEEAEKIHAAVKTALESGAAFTNAVAKFNLEIKTTVPFTVSTQLTDEYGQAIKAHAIYFDQGELCDLIPTPDGFLLAYVAEKTPGDEINQLPGMRAELVDELSKNKTQLLIASWNESILKEAEFVDLMHHSEDVEGESSDS